MKNLIKKLLNENLNEFAQSEHIFNRLNGRLGELTDDEISRIDIDLLNRYMSILRELNFEPTLSFGLRLIELDINPKSQLYYQIRDRGYYRIDDFMGFDSTGDEIWLIIRNNKAVTIMLRKSIQPESNLNVDYVIRSIGELQKAIERGLVK